MDKKITRRVMLGTVIGGLALGPFVMRYYRRNPTNLAVEKEGRIDLYFSEAPSLDMPDVSKYEENFDAILSLAPLSSNTRRFSKLLYETKVEQLAMLTVGELVIRDKTQKLTKQNVEKEWVFVNSEDGESKEILVDQKNVVEGQQISPEIMKYLNVRIKMTLDGRTISISQPNMFPREISGKYLTTPIKAGLTWKQTFAVDSSLNPGGLVEANCEAISTYVKDGERFVRIKRELSYTAFSPELNPKTGTISLKNRTNGTMKMRVVECCDFHVGNGYNVFENSKSVIYIDRPKLNGVLTTSSVTTILKLVS